jgi:hypothetical protein
MSVFGASFSFGYGVSISSTWSSHEHLDMGPRFIVAVGLLHHGGFHSYTTPQFTVAVGLLHHGGLHSYTRPWFSKMDPIMEGIISYSLAT